jgi:hypothetical protein
LGHIFFVYRCSLLCFIFSYTAWQNFLQGTTQFSPNGVKIRGNFPTHVLVCYIDACVYDCPMPGKLYKSRRTRWAETYFCKFACTLLTVCVCTKGELVHIWFKNRKPDHDTKNKMLKHFQIQYFVALKQRLYIYFFILDSNAFSFSWKFVVRV